MERFHLTAGGTLGQGDGLARGKRLEIFEVAKTAGLDGPQDEFLLAPAEVVIDTGGRGYRGRLTVRVEKRQPG
jgi:hypothetical protein